MEEDERFTEPPPVIEDSPSNAAKKRRGLAGLGVFAVLILTKLKAIGMFLLPVVKLLKLGKIMTTSGSMLVSIWFYSLLFGWPFAVGLVLLIFVHEMGHVFVAWRQGLPISAPIFIPGMGAVILAKQSGKSAWNEAVMGIGGPVAGALSGFACWAIYSSTGNEFYLGLAFFAFMINLFNMMPVFPLDGGWITAAISPYLWLVGFLGLGAMFVTGWLRNPFILLLLIISIPRLWQGIRHGIAHPPGVVPATGQQKITMGVYYIALSGILAWGMAETHVDRTPPKEEAGVQLAFVALPEEEGAAVGIDEGGPAPVNLFALDSALD